MLRTKNTLPLVFVLAAVGVATATAIGILMLPTVGSIRYQPTDSRSAVSQLRSSLQGIGFTQPSGAIQFLLRRDTHPLAFRAATYWASSDIDTRRNDYLAAGSIVVLVLLIGAFVWERRASESAPTT